MARTIITHKQKFPLIDPNIILKRDFLPPPTNIGLTWSITDVTCFGGNNGSINLSVSTTYSISYYWSNGSTLQDLNSLSAGNYNCTLTIDQTGETQSTGNIVISQPTAISFTYSISYPGGLGAIDLSVSGGTPGYSYTWTGPDLFYASTQDISGLTAGNYNCEILDQNGCIVNTGNIPIS